MQLRFLIISGPHSKPAVVDFVPGLNVIYGGSNTGKSHILRMIDYRPGRKQTAASLSSSKLNTTSRILEWCSMTVGKDAGPCAQGRRYPHHRRPVPGGPARSRASRCRPVMAPRSRCRRSFSRSSVRPTSASKPTRPARRANLSYRDLERFAIVNETKIRRNVPGPDRAIHLKDGRDVGLQIPADRSRRLALDMAKPDASRPLRQAAQLELLDQQIREFEREITEADQDHEELQQLDLTLDNELADTFSVQEEAERDYRVLTTQRRQMRREYENVHDRIDEIDTLQARFALLSSTTRRTRSGWLPSSRPAPCSPSRKVKSARSAARSRSTIGPNSPATATSMRSSKPRRPNSELASVRPN